MKFDVVTFGSAFHDVYITSDDFEFHKSDSGVMLCEEYGEKVTVKKRISTTGGGATNAAVCFERLGLQSAIVACLGDEYWGRMVRHQLHDEGVSLLYLQQAKNEPTSSSIALVGKDGGRTVLVHRAASNRLTWRDVDWRRLNARWVYVSSLGGDFALLSKIMRWAKEKSVKVALNPGSGELKESEELGKYFKYVDVLIMNKEELAVLLGKKNDDISKSEILGLRAKMSLITNGKKGACLYCEDGKIYKQSSIKVVAVEETGAGDAFGSTFVGGLIKNIGIEKSLKIAALNSSSVVQQIGPKEGLLFWPEILRLLN